MGFDFNPSQYVTGNPSQYGTGPYHDPWTNGLHFTATTDGTGCCSYGSRIPAIFFHPDLGMHIHSSVSGNGDNMVNTERPALNTWTHFEISQRFENNQYIYRIMIDGKEVAMR